MAIKKTLLILLAMVCLALANPVGRAEARPPKPGPNYVWIAPHVNPGGVHIKGHWKHVGPAKMKMVWAPGHRNKHGVWIPGHWKVN